MTKGIPAVFVRHGADGDVIAVPTRAAVEVCSPIGIQPPTTQTPVGLLCDTRVRGLAAIENTSTPLPRYGTEFLLVTVTSFTSTP